MSTLRKIVKGSFLAALIASVSACIVAEPREGYYDAGHHRYYGGHVWHECGVGDEHCR